MNSVGRIHFTSRADYTITGEIGTHLLVVFRARIVDRVMKPQGQLHLREVLGKVRGGGQRIEAFLDVPNFVVCPRGSLYLAISAVSKLGGSATPSRFHTSRQAAGPLFIHSSPCRQDDQPTAAAILHNYRRRAEAMATTDPSMHATNIVVPNHVGQLLAGFEKPTNISVPSNSPNTPP